MWHRTRLLLLCGLALLLSGCGADLRPPTYGEIIQTAEARGCWPTLDPTPLPITVTPLGGTPTATPTVVLNPGAPTQTPAPTATALPTTTPLPRCPPEPGATLEPWPTPLPTEAAVPTREVEASQAVVNETTAMHLPNAVLGLDLAVHPTRNWPAVAAIDIPVVNQDRARVFVRVYHPDRGGWGTAQNVDVGASHPGERFRSVAVGVAGDGTVHAVWGVTEFPELAIYSSFSTDAGETWSAPERLGTGMFGVLDVAATLDGQVFALAIQRDPVVAPVLFHRSADGQWGNAEALPVGPVWYGSGGALVVAGDGTDPNPQLVAIVTGSDARPDTAYLLNRPFVGGAWSVGSRELQGSGGLAGAVQGVRFSWRDPSGAMQPGVAFAVTSRETASVTTLTSLDAGRSWSAAEPVVRSGRVSSGADGTSILAAAPAYDPRTQSLAVIWPCCADALWGSVEATHYASRSAVGSGAWLPALRPETFDDRIPLISNAQSAGLTVSAQALNAPSIWLAWIENGRQVRVRTLDLSRVVVYPQ